MDSTTYAGIACFLGFPNPKFYPKVGFGRLKFSWKGMVSQSRLGLDLNRMISFRHILIRLIRVITGVNLKYVLFSPLHI